jgi:hypothetical protein
MATYIVNPTAASNGTGSLVDPKNTYTGITTSPGDTILQVAGTTWNGRYTVSTGGSSESTRVTLGVCEPQTGVQILDGSRRAAINAAGQDRGIAVAAGQHYVTIWGLEVYGPDTGNRRCISFGSSSSNVCNFVTIKHCDLHDPVATSNDSNAIWGAGSDTVIENNIIHDIATDAVWLQGFRARVDSNWIWNVGTDGRQAGDCVQIFGDSTLGSAGAIVRNNYLDHSNGSFKQCIIVQTSGSDVGAVIAGNVCLMADYDGNDNNNIFVDIGNARVVGNVIRGGRYGVFVDANNARIMGNVVYRPDYGIVQGSALTGARVYLNTVLECGVYGLYADEDTSFNAQNNIIANCAIGIGHENGATEDYNCFFGNGTNKVSLGGGAVSLGANDITSDPLLTSDYRLTESSPCRGEGVYIPEARHFGGTRLSVVAPDIGAYRYEPLRSLALNRAIS